MKVKVFKVFHRAIDERLLFDLFTPTEVEEFFTMYGVNEAQPEKSVTKIDGITRMAGTEISHLLLEYQLPWHDASIQAQGFMETSAYIHLHQNRLHESLDYVGVAQYDMRWTSQAVATLRELATTSPENRNIAYGLSVGMIANSLGQAHPATFGQLCSWPFMLQSYNRFFKRDWDAKMLIDKPFTLWQTYLLPRRQFADLASWLAVLCSELYPWANQQPYPTHWGHMAGWAERAESIFIAARLAEGQITFEPLHLHHDESIPKKLAVSKNHYGSQKSDQS